MPDTLIYGLRIRCPFALPGEAVPGEEPADVTVHVGARPADAERWSESDAQAFYRSEHVVGDAPSLVADRPGDAGILRLRYAEGIRFHIAARGDEIWCEWRAPLTEADAVTFLLGPVMGSVIRRRGVIALHASAVVIDDGAWAFIGPGGSGKSTLAAGFGARGRALLAEDVLALRPAAAGWSVMPAYRGIRLWDDAAGMLAQGAKLPPLTPSWPKLDLDLARHGLPFATSPAPLRGLLVLDDYLAPGEPPQVRPLPSKDLMVELIANVYANYLADGTELAREFNALLPIAQSIPGWRLAPGAGPKGVAESCRAVESLAERSA